MGTTSLNSPFGGSWKSEGMETTQKRMASPHSGPTANGLFINRVNMKYFNIIEQLHILHQQES